jgi:hypothetical protein
MSRRRGIAPGSAALFAAVLLVGPAGAQSELPSVTVDRAEISTGLGSKFSFQTTIANAGATTTPALIAHLNFLSLREGTYVDPEDWSGQRTQYLGTIPADESRTIAWRVTAVNGGSFGAYVAVLPQNNPAEPPAVSPTVEITIAERKTLNSGGILPLALGIPAFVGLLAGGVRIARRRR